MISSMRKLNKLKFDFNLEFCTQPEVELSPKLRANLCLYQSVLSNG